MEIFKTFGLDLSLTVAQIVNFLIILFILKRFLYKPIFKILKKREDLVKETIEKSEESKKALEKAQREEKEVIKKAQATANQILKDAREQASDLIKRGEEAAKKQTQYMIEEAKVQIQRETKEAEQQLTKQVGNLSVEILRKSLGSIFTEKDQTEIVKRAVTALGKRSN